eukprot:17920-Pleurochrysis_carterae.AAC.1
MPVRTLVNRLAFGAQRRSSPAPPKACLERAKYGLVSHQGTILRLARKRAGSPKWIRRWDAARTRRARSLA